MSYNFTSTSDVLSFDVGTGTRWPAALSWWMRTTQTGTLKQFLSMNDGPGGGKKGFAVAMQSGKLQCYATDAAGAFPRNWTGTTTVNDGNWHHIALNNGKASGAACALYVDGALDGSGTNSSAVGGTTQPLRLGLPTDTFWSGYIGEIAEFACWDSTGAAASHFTADEIAALAKGFSPFHVRRSGLFVYAPLVREQVEVLGQVNPVFWVGAAPSAHPRRIY